MSKQIDEKVVSLQFDNKHFESNVKTTMSTLDKLKEKFNFKSASKGFENVGAAAKKVDMSHMSKGVEEVRTRFSALEVMGVTALANITNSAVNAGKRIVSALTVAPVMDGFREYEMTLNAVQTTMAGTGKTAEEVEQQLKRLDEYADKTVYSTADMLNNLPKFTNAGVELDKATTAMIGIANATALAGGDAGKASIAFYNLGQAIGTGYLTRMDYNSINNAGIATMEWKNQMVEAAIAAGTLKKAGEDAYVAGGKTFTLQQLFIDGLQKQWATTDVMMKVFEDYGNEQTEIGKKAYSSAQDIKTFTMMMDSLKATAGTGWKDTWQIIFGGLEDAKVFWTGLSNFISGIITKMADLRNGILESALGKGFTELSEKIKTIMKPVSVTAETIKGVTNALKDYSTIVDEIIAGKWGNAPTRWQDLAKAGYDWAHAQNLVNERLGDSTRHATDYTEAVKEVSDSQQKQADSSEKLSKANIKTLIHLAALSDAELKDKKLKDDQIAALRELVSLSEQLGMPMSELLENLDKINGRWLLIESFKNIGQALTTVFKSMSDAWKEIFTGLNVESIGKGIFNLIAAFYKFSRMLTISETSAENLKRTFKGLFAVLDIVTTVVSGPIKIAFKILGQLLSVVFKGFDLTGAGILEFTAIIGDMLVGVRDSVDAIFDVSKAFEKILPYIQSAVTAVKDWITSLKDSDNIPRDIITGLINGLKNGVMIVGQTVIEIGKAIIENIKNVLGIHSPSTVMFEVGKNTIQGLINGVKDGASGLFNFFKDIGAKIVNFIKNIDFGSVFAFAISTGVVIALVKLASVVDAFASPLEGLGDLLHDLDKGLKSMFKAKALEARANAIKSFAIAIGILAASVYVLSKIDTTKLIVSVVALGALAGVILLMSKLAAGIDISGAGLLKLSVCLVSMSASLFIMASAIKKLEFLDGSNVGPILLTLIVMIGGLAGILAAFGQLVKGKAAMNIDKAGITIAKISIAMLLLTAVIKKVSKLEPGEVVKGSIAIAMFGALITGLIAATRLAGKHIASVGSTILQISAAMLLLVFVIKAISKLEPQTIAKGILCISLFGALIIGLVAMSRLAGGGVKGIASSMVGISAAILMLGLTSKIFASMSVGEIAKGLIAVTLFGAVVVALVKIAKSGDGSMKGVALTLLALSVSIGILAAVAMMLSLLKLEALAKGITAVGMLGGIMALMMSAAKNVKGCKVELIVLTVAIGIMAAAVAALSFIDPGKLAMATLAMAGVMGMFALMIKAMSALKPGAKSFTRGLIVLGTLTLIVGVLAGVLAALSYLPNPNALVPSAVAIGSLLLAMTASITVLSNSKTMSVQKLTRSLISLGVMTLVVGALGVILATMSQLNVQNGVQNALALSALLIAMTGCLAVLTLIGSFASNSFVGIAALTLMVVPLAAFALALAYLPDVSDKIGTITVLTGTMVAMTALLAILSVIGLLIGASGGIALLGIAGLTLMVVPLSAFALALAYLPDVSGAINTVKLLSALMIVMSDVLFKVSILGPLALIGVSAITALSKVMLTIGVLAAAIGALMTKFPVLEEFVDKGMTILAKLAFGLGSIIGNFISGFAVSALSGLPQIGLLLSQFMVNAMPFITGIKMVDAQALKGVGVLAGVVIALTAANLIEGIASFLSGGDSFSRLGAELSSFMINAMPFISGASLLTDDMTNGVKNLAIAIGILTAADVVDGLTSWLTGGSSISSFGADLAAMGAGIASFATSMGNLDESQLERINVGSEAIKKLAEAAKDIPNEGGWAGVIFGDNSLGGFSEGIKKTGEALQDFVIGLGSFGKGELDKVSSACEAITTLAKAAKEIPNEGGFWAGLCGDNSLADFSENLPSIAEDVAEFANKAGDMDPDKAKRAVDMVTALTGLADVGVDNVGSNLEEFGAKVASFAGKIGDFCAIMASISQEAITTSTTKIVEFVNAITQIANSEIGSIQTFGESLKTAGVDGVNAFIGAFSDGSAKSKLTKAVDTLVNSAVDKIKSQGNYNKFKKAGKYLVEGFCAGISENTYMVKAKAQAMAQAASDAANAELNINSPSRVFMKTGASVVEGFAKGITDNVGDAESSARKMGNSVLKATQDELKINSPSIVFEEKVGRYIVQGIAKGIEKETSAEKAASEKANAIVEAFNKELNKYSTEGDIAEGTLQLWKKTEGINATKDELADKDEEYLKGQLERAKTRKKLYADEVYTLQQQVNSTKDKKAKSIYQDSLREAQKNYIDAQNEEADIYAELQATADSRITSRIDAIDRVREYEDAELSKWLETEGVTASEEAIDEMYRNYYDRLGNDLQSKSELLTEAYGQAMLSNGPDSDAVHDALMAIYDNDAKIRENENNKIALAKSEVRRQIDDLEELQKDYDDSFDHWLAAFGSTVSEKEVDARTIASIERDNTLIDKKIELETEYLNKFEWGSKEHKEISDKILSYEREKTDNLNEIKEIKRKASDYISEAISNNDSEHELWLALHPDADEDEIDAREITKLRWTNDRIEELIAEDEKLLLTVKKGSEDEKAATERILQNKTKKAQNLNEIDNIEEAARKRHYDSLRTQYDIAIEAADLEYQIWEKTSGRKATSNEKDAYKVSILSRQLVYETKSLEVARDEWEDAVEEYGKSSNEANEAYNKYLQKQLDIATMQSDITNITEKSAERQRIAQSEYKKYVEKYKKYYLKNGMTLEDLERDAKLVTGYDSSNTTPQSIISKTAEALEEVLDSSEYQKVLDTFGTIGTSYVTAVKDGATAQAAEAVNAVIDLSAKCVTVLRETQSMWLEAGKYVIAGFANGLAQNVGTVANAAYTVAQVAINTMRATLDVNSPSRVSEEIGKFTVLGLVNGIIDNAGLASGAASELANVTIDNLRNSIKRVTEAIENDVDTQPTIRPVLDLTDVEAGAARIGGMFSRSQAVHISNGMHTSDSDTNQNGGTSGGNTYQFTQNNYSPKALSRREIYRQTKNQFAAMKGATT